MSISSWLSFACFLCHFFIRVKLVRLGHPARLLPQVLESALDAQVIITFILQRKNLDNEILFFG